VKRAGRHFYRWTKLAIANQLFCRSGQEDRSLIKHSNGTQRCDCIAVPRTAQQQPTKEMSASQHGVIPYSFVQLWPRDTTTQLKVTTFAGSARRPITLLRIANTLPLGTR